METLNFSKVQRTEWDQIFIDFKELVSSRILGHSPITLKSFEWLRETLVNQVNTVKS